MTTEKLSITLPKDYADLIRSKVSSGSYASQGEVVREALLVWSELETLQAKRLQGLQMSIRESLKDPRPSISEEEAFRALEGLR